VVVRDLLTREDRKIAAGASPEATARVLVEATV
jgi:hypothetical protein